MMLETIIDEIDDVLLDLKRSIKNFQDMKTDQNCYAYAYDIGSRDAFLYIRALIKDVARWNDANNLNEESH